MDGTQGRQLKEGTGSGHDGGPNEGVRVRHTEPRVATQTVAQYMTSIEVNVRNFLSVQMLRQQTPHVSGQESMISSPSLSPFLSACISTLNYYYYILF